MKALHIGRGEVYESDFATLKRYRPDYYRITLHKMIRRAGYEAEDGEDGHRKGKKNTADLLTKVKPKIEKGTMVK